ncbi:hypothetical protein DYI24_20880 [Rhodopseudomonas sp. BR0C11]|uniref:hypothetical protein n=1 Tax=Rhodopseudomonas sp. BR0C11 TaxID=2269370 RepID=UPI0013E03EB6|nr:hypothetical protein [Rhodopseudomonas sp. BR0C11]NEV79494.1 hypothetical protein [Rhodopseudomonas sp. BR0C11]
MFGMRTFDRHGVGRAILSFFLRAAPFTSAETTRTTRRNHGRGHYGSKRRTYPRSGVGRWGKRHVLKGVRP